MHITILAKDFAKAQFGRYDQCPVANAIRDEFNTDDVIVGFAFCYINLKYYVFTPYYEPDFDLDHQLAAARGFDNSAIRVIELSEKH
jgi:hypothetical protein